MNARIVGTGPLKGMALAVPDGEISLGRDPHCLRLLICRRLSLGTNISSSYSLLSKVFS